MISLPDRHGRRWVARLTIGAALDLRDLADIDVIRLGLDAKAARQFTPADAADAVYILCREQCETLGLSSHQFGRLLKPTWYRRRGTTPQELLAQWWEEFDRFWVVPARERIGKESSAPTPEEMWNRVWNLAGLAGVDPRPFTFGELVAIARGQEEFAWCLNANVMATVSNSNPFRKGKGIDPAELDPTGAMKPSRKRGITRITNTPNGAVVQEL